MSINIRICGIPAQAKIRSYNPGDPGCINGPPPMIATRQSLKKWIIGFMIDTAIRRLGYYARLKAKE